MRRVASGSIALFMLRLSHTELFRVSYKDWGTRTPMMEYRNRMFN